MGSQSAKRGHTCAVPRCDGTQLGHDLAVDFPDETQQVDEALDSLRFRPRSLGLGLTIERLEADRQPATPAEPAGQGEA